MPNYLISFPIENPDPKCITHFVTQINSPNIIRATEFCHWLYRNFTGKDAAPNSLKPRLFKAKSQIIDTGNKLS